MTETTLRLYLRVSGWATILAVFVQFALMLIQRNNQMIELNMEPALRSEMNLFNAVGLGFEIPLALTFACLCLMAARVLAFKQQTLQTIFE